MSLRRRELGKEARFRLLFEDNPQPMWVVDCGTLDFLEVNRAAVEHYGYSREEFLRMRASDLVPEDDAPGAKPARLTT